MKTSFHWIGGFAAGMIAYHFIVGPEVNTPLPPEQTPVQEVERPESKPLKPAAVIPSPQTQDRMKEPIKTNRTKEIVSQKPRQKRDLSLSESVISRMEYDWNDLPLKAEARREDRGWRFIRIDGNSDFFRAGFREGDLVTTEFLDKLGNSDARLITRMEQILNRITR